VAPRIHPIHIDVLDKENIYLQWDVESLSPEPRSHWSINIRTAFSEGGPWSYIARGLSLNTYAVRHKVPRRDRWAIPFYIIDLVHTDDESRSVSSDIVYPRHPPDTRAIGIRQRLQQPLRGEHGVRISFLKKRIEGTVDEEAFDDLLHRPTGRRGKSFGYQYEDGFYKPIDTWAKIDVDPRILQSLPVAPVAVSESQCWLAGTPLVAPGDVIVEWHVNRRWRVGSHIQRFARRQTLFRQVFSIKEIALNDPEYDIEIPQMRDIDILS